ncbi:cytochrome oxidase putative small subunit CydP [uncultured Legionella sp.]|uniref:cytochrome oxidase putative small subunit CydP n=1 Tax=uncultured Legionella sp. TaxID=210934 RepID=UPI0026255401|nr:cytochrome oxidase putative small subunit CydP [uncultured Legionella sp.]
MKTYARDITLTLIVKAILLFLLWYVCVRGMHPTLSNAKEWMLGKEEQSISTQIKKR